MKAFADLYAELDSTTKTNEKIGALKRYFIASDPADIAWAVHFLIGRRPKRLIETRKLVEWAIAEAAIPDWLFGESYSAVGDLAETISLLLPPPATSTGESLHYWVEERLLPLKQWEDRLRQESLVNAWRELNERQRFVWNKLITGEFRVGVSANLVVRALAEASGVDSAVLFHRLMGNWDPTADFARSVLAKESPDADISRPYPFCLAHPLEGEVEELGDIGDWQAEWKWDGIRAQLIRRQGQTFVWSRGEELMTDRFPELQKLGGLLPNGVAIDGEIMPWKSGQPMGFGQLQRRIGRKVLGPKILSEGASSGCWWRTTCSSTNRRISANSRWNGGGRGFAGYRAIRWRPRAGHGAVGAGARGILGEVAASAAASRGNGASKGSCSSAWARPIGWDGNAAIGGSGRSSPIRSTRCWCTPSRVTGNAPASSRTIHSRSGTTVSWCRLPKLIRV